jgi:putative ABC transport system permease protein
MGDRIRVDLVDRDHKRVDVTVTGIVESYVGLVAYMRLDELDHLAGDGARLTGVRISVDRTRLDALYRKLKAIPAIGAVALQGVSRDNFRKTIAENITIMTTVYTILAVIITFGLIYNSARIQLSERARELASLRVLGFTRAEVSSVLLIELAVIIAFAQPLGWLFGWLFSWSVVEGFDSDLFRIPFVINVSTFAVASLVVIVAAALSALVVRRRVDRLDLVRVLKTRE